MKRNQIIMLTVFLFGTVVFDLLSWRTVLAQDSVEVKADTTKSEGSKEPKKKDSNASDIKEMVLEEIQIQAVIEKPRVAILPKRREPELGKLEFVDRSFENELKKIPQKPMLIEEDLKTISKIRKLDTSRKEKDRVDEKVKKENNESNKEE